MLLTGSRVGDFVAAVRLRPSGTVRCNRGPDPQTHLRTPPTDFRSTSAGSFDAQREGFGCMEALEFRLPRHRYAVAARACRRPHMSTRKPSAAARSNATGNFNEADSMSSNMCTFDHCVGSVTPRQRHRGGRASAVGRDGFAGIEDRIGHMRQRTLLHHRAALESRARHSVDQRRFFVLAECHAAGLAQFQKTFGTILPHASQNRADRRLCRTTRAAERNRTSTDGR